MASIAAQRSATFGGDPTAELALAIAGIPLWLGAMVASGGYQAAYFNAGSDVVARFLTGTVGGVLALTFLTFVTGLQISRPFVAILAGTAFVLGLIARLAFRALLLHAYRSDRLTERTMLIGHGEYADDLARLLIGTTGIPYRLGAVLSTADAGRPDDTWPGVPIVRGLDDVRRTCDELDIDAVLVVSGALDATQVRDVFVRLEGAPQKVLLAPAMFPLLPWRMSVETITGLPLVHIGERRMVGARAAAKRSIDLVGAAILLVVLSPIALLAMLGVLLADGRPVLFRQARIGRDGRPFTLWKIRTMVLDAEDRLDHLRDDDTAGGHFFKLQDDPRVTRLGRVLRTWSIDEIPQLLNVLGGSMALVGPRPLFSTPAEYDFVERRRLSVRPGLTGLWQTSGRSMLDGAQAMQKDLFYIENWTLLGDLIILARTVLSVLSRRGAT